MAVTLRHASPATIVKLVSDGEVDFGVTTNRDVVEDDLVILPSHKFERIVIVPRGHELECRRKISLKLLSTFPLIAYDEGFSGRMEIMKAFQRAKLNPRIALTASDADVIKSCVEQGLGIAVVLNVVFNPERDKGIVAIPASSLFPQAQTSVVLRRRHHFRKCDYEFVEMLSPRWHRSNIQRASI